MANDISSCSICYSDIETVQLKANLAFEGKDSLDSKNMLGIRTKCNHIFHESCLAQWISVYKTRTSPPPCPNCRTPLMNNGVVIPQQINQPSTHNPTQPIMNNEAIFEQINNYLIQHASGRYVPRYY